MREKCACVCMNVFMEQKFKREEREVLVVKVRVQRATAFLF